jgi:hypothetical protein
MTRASCVVALLVLSGCTGVVGYRFPSPGEGGVHVDCGALAGDTGTGLAWQLSGPGNAVEVEAVGLVICAEASSDESLYLVGPILPVIPMFGLGSSGTGDVRFVLVTSSEEAPVQVRAPDGREHLVEAGAPVEIVLPWAERFDFVVIPPDGEPLPVSFRPARGTFVIVTG